MSTDGFLANPWVSFPVCSYSATPFYLRLWLRFLYYVTMRLLKSDVCFQLYRNYSEVLILQENGKIKLRGHYTAEDGEHTLDIFSARCLQVIEGVT